MLSRCHTGQSSKKQSLFLTPESIREKQALLLQFSVQPPQRKRPRFLRSPLSLPQDKAGSPLPDRRPALRPVHSALLQPSAAFLRTEFHHKTAKGCILYFQYSLMPCLFRTKHAVIIGQINSRFNQTALCFCLSVRIIAADAERLRHMRSQLHKIIPAGKHEYLLAKCQRTLFSEAHLSEANPDSQTDRAARTEFFQLQQCRCSKNNHRKCGSLLHAPFPQPDRSELFRR